MGPKRGTARAANGVHAATSSLSLALEGGCVTVGGHAFMEGCSQAVSLRGTSAVVGDNGCDGATDPGPDTPKTTVDAAILGFRNTHPAWDDDPESDLRILRDRHVV